MGEDVRCLVLRQTPTQRDQVRDAQPAASRPCRCHLRSATAKPMRRPIGCIQHDGVAISAAGSNLKSCGSIIHALLNFLPPEEGRSQAPVVARSRPVRAGSATSAIRGRRPHHQPGSANVANKVQATGSMSSQHRYAAIRCSAQALRADNNADRHRILDTVVSGFSTSQA